MLCVEENHRISSYTIKYDVRLSHILLTEIFLLSVTKNLKMELTFFWKYREMVKRNAAELSELDIQVFTYI